MPSILLGTGNTAVNTTEGNLCFYEPYCIVDDRQKKSVENWMSGCDEGSTEIQF